VPASVVIQPAGDVPRRIWEWLPSRAVRSRVTTAHVIAANLEVDPRDVTAELAWMERSGHVIRNRSTGYRSGGWHRGRALPPAVSPAAETPEEWTLC